MKLGLGRGEGFQLVERVSDELGKALVAGTVRPGLDAEDVILALAGLWQLDPAGDWRSQARRIYDIVLSGLQRSS